MVYTQKALDGAGGQDGIDALIDERILATNQALEQSQVTAQVRLVGSSLVLKQASN